MVSCKFSLKPIHGSKFQVTPPMAFPGRATLGALRRPGPIHGVRGRRTRGGTEGGRGGGGGVPGGGLGQGVRGSRVASTNISRFYCDYFGIVL
jgi:hypothetical protein